MSFKIDTNTNHTSRHVDRVTLSVKNIDFAWPEFQISSFIEKSTEL